MKISYILPLLVACTDHAETKYPNSAGPMGVGSDSSNENPPEDSGAPSNDTGEDNGRDTGREDTGPT